MIVSYADYIFYFFDGCEFMSNKYKYVKSYRSTNMGGVTKYIAICTTCKRIIPPVNTRRSRSGTHGEDYYTHEHELEFILLYSSNRGNRSVSVPNTLKPIQEQLEVLWVYENAPLSKIIEFINSYLSKL